MRFYANAKQRTIATAQYFSSGYLPVANIDIYTNQEYDKMDPGQAHGIDVNKCAEKAVKAIAKGKHRKLLGSTELLMVYIHKYFLGLYYKLARKVSAV